MTGITVEPGSPTATERLLRRVTTAAVAVAASLAVIKAAAWMITGSVAIAASMIDSVLDMLASGVNLWAVRIAQRPADHDHRFGHGKAEPLAGLAQSAFVLGSAAFLSLEAINRLLNPVPVGKSPVGVAVMVVAIAVTIGLVAYQRRVIRQTRSVAIEADSLHYTGDILVNLAAIAGLVLAAEAGWAWADPVFALSVAGVLIYGAYRIGRSAIDQLMDHELPAEDRQAILALACEHPRVRDCHDLKTRVSGRTTFVQLHVVMDGALPLIEAHEIGALVSGRIAERFPDAEIIVHHDPDASVPDVISPVEG